MKKNIFSALSIASVYITAVIGAGFASGAEVAAFFAVYGPKSLWGVLTAGALFIAVGVRAAAKIRKTGAEGYGALLSPLIGKTAAAAVEIIVFLFLLSGFCVMVAGSGALAGEFFNINGFWGVAALLLASFLAVFAGERSMALMSLALLPPMLFGIFFLSSSAVLGAFSPLAVPFSASLYISYNCLNIVPVLAPFVKNAPNKKTALWGAALGGAGLFICLFAVWLPLITFSERALWRELPFLYIASLSGRAGGAVYAAVLFFAMCTTAAANAFAIINRLKSGRAFAALGLCALSVPLSYIGFTALMGALYTFFGYVGLGLLLVILLL